MDTAMKIRLRHAIKTFYDLHHDQEKGYTYKEFKECGYNKSQVYRIYLPMQAGASYQGFSRECPN